VVEGRLDVIDTDGVDTQALHQSSVTHAGIAVGQRIALGVNGVGATGLITVISHTSDVRAHCGESKEGGNAGMREISLNTDDLEALLGIGVDKVFAIDLKSLQGECRASQGTGGRKETTGRLYIYRVSILITNHDC
jgi:hypothetical protein